MTILFETAYYHCDIICSGALYSFLLICSYLAPVSTLYTYWWPWWSLFYIVAFCIRLNSIKWQMAVSRIFPIDIPINNIFLFVPGVRSVSMAVQQFVWIFWWMPDRERSSHQLSNIPVADGGRIAYWVKAMVVMVPMVVVVVVGSTICQK